MPLQITPSGGIATALTPAPFLSISKRYIRDGAGNVLRPEYDLALNGTIVNTGGDLDSPAAQSSGISINDNVAEQNRIRQLFGQSPYVKLEVTSPDNSAVVMSAYCQVMELAISPSTWTTKTEYTVQLKTNALSNDHGSETQSGLSQASEEWSFSENENGTVSVSHEMNATGEKVYSSTGLNDPLTLAKDWCQSRKATVSNGILSVNSPESGTTLGLLSAASGYWNRSVQEGVGSSNNSWRISESFVLVPSGNTVHDRSYSLEYSLESPDKSFVKLNGTIAGLANNARDGETRTTNALADYYSNVDTQLYTRAVSLAPTGFTVNPSYMSKTVSVNQSNGTLQYDAIFTATSGTRLITGSIEESVEVQDAAPTDVFAQIPIPGRANGPVVQYMGTVELPKRTVNISAIMPINQTLSLRNRYLSKPNTGDIVAALCPASGYYYLENDTETWNPLKQQYSRSVSWVILNTAESGIPAVVHYVS